MKESISLKAQRLSKPDDSRPIKHHPLHRITLQFMQGYLYCGMAVGQYANIFVGYLIWMPFNNKKNYFHK